eukprot:1513808-Amphidinium_carterae.2
MAKGPPTSSWVLQEDGSYRPADVPGPPDFVSWAACYKVYCAALLMLRYADGTCVVCPQTLEVYFEKFRELVSEKLEFWFLCVTAEDPA